MSRQVHAYHASLGLGQRLSNYEQVGPSWATRLDSLKYPETVGPPLGVGERTSARSTRWAHNVKVAGSPPTAGGDAHPDAPPAALLRGDLQDFELLAARITSQAEPVWRLSHGEPYGPISRTELARNIWSLGVVGGIDSISDEGR